MKHFGQDLYNTIREVIAKINATKDMKATRRFADWFHMLVDLDEESIKIETLTKEVNVKINDLKVALVKSNIGSRPLREDIFSRLVFVELLWNT